MRQNWVVTTRVSGSIKPVAFEYAATAERAEQRAAVLREHARRAGRNYRISVAEVIEEVRA